MARVFVSYARKDSALADMVCHWLDDATHEVFLDLKIQPGEGWSARLHERLRWADAVVCLVSNASVASAWCVTELAIALSRGSRIIPLQVEANLQHPIIPGIQHINLSNQVHDAKSRLLDVLRLVDAEGGSGWPDGRSPFPGLQPFDTDYKSVFFGRSYEVKELSALLRSPPERSGAQIVLIVGPSGCGKSSLLRAGLLPAIAAEPEWLTLTTIRPGPKPVETLAREVAAGFRGVRQATLSEIQRRIDNDGFAQIVEELLLLAPGRRRTRLVVPIDQFEELFTQTTPAERVRFVNLLQQSATDSISIVGTIRPEFLETMLSSEPSDRKLDYRLFPVHPLLRDALSDVIKEPARRAGIEVDDDLVNLMIADTASGAALPLLAYTLEQLSEGVGRGGRLLTSRYKQLGGVRAALTRQADAALADAVSVGRCEPAAIIRELVRLVKVDDEGRPTGWRRPRNVLGAFAEAALAPFVARRLLTTDNDNIQVAHEAFLSAWPPLAEMISENGVALQAQRRVEQAAAEWEQSEKSQERLWTGDQLGSARRDVGLHFKPSSPSAVKRRLRLNWPIRRAQRQNLAVDADITLTDLAKTFLYASIRRDQFLRRRISTVLAVLLVFAVIAAGTAIVQLNIARAQQRLATARLLMSDAQSEISADPRTALRLAEAARHLDPAPETAATLGRLLRETPYRGAIDGIGSPILAAAFSPGSDRLLAIATANGKLSLWDLNNPTQPHSIGAPLANYGAVSSLSFSPDGRTLAAASGKNVVLWDVTSAADPQLIGQPLGGHTDRVTAVTYTSDGRTLATASDDGSVIMWDVSNRATPRQLGVPITENDQIQSAVFTPDGRTLATSGFYGTVLLWDVANPLHPRQLSPPFIGLISPVSSIAAAPDGRSLVVANGDGHVLLWDITDRSQPHKTNQSLTGQTGTVNAMAFSRSGHALATAGSDRTTLLWDVSDFGHTQRIGQPLTGHTGAVSSVAFTADGQYVATAGADGQVLLWDATGSSESRLTILARPPGPVSSIAFSHDGASLAVAGADRTTELWGVADPTKPRRIGEFVAGRTGAIASMGFSPNGQLLVTSISDGTALLWDISDPARPRSVGSPFAGLARSSPVIAFSPDGRFLVLAGEDTSMQVWDVSSNQALRSTSSLDSSDATPVTSVAFTPDGRTLATVRSDGTALLWDASHPENPRQIGPPFTKHGGSASSIAFSSDASTLLALNSNGTFVIWDTRDPLHPQEITHPTPDNNAVVAVALTHDGHTLATSDSYGAILLWDVTDPAHPQRIEQDPDAHDGRVSSITFSENGQTLALARTDKTVALRDLSDVLFSGDTALRVACERTAGSFEPGEWSRTITSVAYEDSCPP